MVINLRYFVITIISIFLSLGLGIFIGAILDGQQVFINQQKQLVMEIEEQFYTFQEEKEKLKSELELYKKENQIKDEFIDDVLNYFLLYSNLDNLKILIINNTKNDISGLINVLKDLGIHEIFEYSSETLEDYDHNKFSDFDYSIVLEDSRGKRDHVRSSLMTSIIEGLRKEEIPVAIIRSKTGVHSSYYKENAITTLDEIDTKIGKVKMIMDILTVVNQGEEKIMSY